nr:hypothetical protein Iba_chr05cCG9620 [Ipomoea batatas]
MGETKRFGLPQISGERKQLYRFTSEPIINIIQRRTSQPWMLKTEKQGYAKNAQAAAMKSKAEELSVRGQEILLLEISFSQDKVTCFTQSHRRTGLLRLVAYSIDEDGLPHESYGIFSVKRSLLLSWPVSASGFTQPLLPS